MGREHATHFLRDSPAWTQGDPRRRTIGSAEHTMTTYALRFISGKYQGGEFALPTDAEMIVGRSGDLDMVLVEDMVSRRHAKMVLDGEGVLIEDLGSTNGTFVNGERITRARLNEGDRILIGTNIIKLVTVDEATEVSTGSSLEDMAAHRRTTQVRSMSGTIDEVPLPDLLQLFGSSRKTGMLVVRTETDVGKVYLEEGTVVFASINDAQELPPLKCACRIVTWRHGSFYMESMPDRDLPSGLEMSTEAVLMEGMRIFDEVQRAGESGALTMRARLSLVQPLEAKLRDLKPAQLDVLQYALNFSTVEAVLNNSPIDDIEMAQELMSLVKTGYLLLRESQEAP